MEEKAMILWTPQELDVIRNTVAKGATPEELQLFAMVCRKTGLDPFSRQIHFIKRKQNIGGEYKMVGTFQTGIDGYRSMAEDTGEYAGQDAPTFEDKEDGSVKSATVAVYRRGFDHPIVATAFYDEYVQTVGDGVPNSMWKKMPRSQLAKCAEALALRKAFPRKIGNIYTHEEMGQAENPIITVEARTMPVPAQNAPTTTTEAVEPKRDAYVYVDKDGTPREAISDRSLVEPKSEPTFEERAKAAFPKAKVSTTTKVDIDKLDLEFEAFLKEELRLEGEELVSILKTWNAAAKTRERLDRAKETLRKPVVVKQASLNEGQEEEQ